MAIYKSIYLINYEENRIERKDTPDDFNTYIDELISNMNSNTSIRRYAPRSQTTQVINLINGIITDTLSTEDSPIRSHGVENKFRDIAGRLLRKEVETQELINRLGQRIKKGSLVQALLQGESTSEYIYLIAKVEHSKYFDEADFRSRFGFSGEQQKIWKSCIMDCLVNDDEITIESAKIYLDKEAKYWHNEFLELEELLNDEVNTKMAFKHIESLLVRIKPYAPSDYIVLRNSFVGHLKNSQHIDYDTMVTGIIDRYAPTELNQEELNTLKGKLRELPEKKKFDSQFNAIPSAINARIRKVYEVNQGIEIKIKDHLGDIKDTIKSFEDPNGDRFIKIKTTNDDTFKAFR